MNPRPEIVLPPGFALRIDYDPESSPASLLITAYRDDAPVGQAHVDPREVGQRLRLEVELGDGAQGERAPRLRLTPQRAMRAILLEAVQESAPPRAQPASREPTPSAAGNSAGEAVAVALAVGQPSPVAAMTVLHALAREGALKDECRYDSETPRAMNAVVCLEGGASVVLPDELAADEARWSRVQRALRVISTAAVDLLGTPLRNPLRLRGADGLAES